MWDKKTGILAAMLTFLNPFFFTYAFEGRMYSIMALGVTASMYFFLKIIHENREKRGSRKSRKNIFGYVFFTLWALYSHHFAIFILFIQGLWFLKEWALGKRQKALEMFKGFVLIGVGYLPWLYPLYNQTKMVGGGFWLGTPTVQDLLKLIGEYLAAGIKHPLSIFAVLPILAILIIRKWHKDLQKSAILLSWFLGPILLTWGVSRVFQSIFFNRYLLYAIPGAMLLVASQRRKISNLIFFLLLPLLLLIDFHYFTHPTKRPFKELATYVKQTRQENDFLINWNAGSHHLWELKFYGIPAPLYIPADGGDLPFFVGTALMEESDVIRNLPENASRIGVVTSGSIDEINLAGYTESERRQLRDLNFVWYVKD